MNVRGDKAPFVCSGDSAKPGVSLYLSIVETWVLIWFLFNCVVFFFLVSFHDSFAASHHMKKNGLGSFRICRASFAFFVADQSFCSVKPGSDGLSNLTQLHPEQL